MKTLTLFGQQVEFTGPDSDVYLDAVAPDGPGDVRPVLQAFCTGGSDVVDVGANIGVTAVMSGVLVDPGRVVAIEPVPDTYEHLEANVARSELTNVTCVRAAASSSAGEVNLVVHPGWGFAAFVGYDRVLDRYVDYSEVSAEAVTLDSLVEAAGLDRLGFVKIDVEGFELEVLRGAEATLAAHAPVVFMEANHYCLNIFRRISMVDFIEEVTARFPMVYALDESGTVLNLTVPSTHQHFFHENVVNGRYPNLLCGPTGAVEEGLHRMGASHA